MTAWGPWSTNGHTDLGVDWSYSGNVLNVTTSLQTHWTYSGNSCTLSYGGTWGGSVGLSITRSNPSSGAVWSGSFTQAYGTTVTLTFSMTGFYDGSGSNCSVTFSSTLPALPPSYGQVALSTTTFDMGTVVTITPNMGAASSCTLQYGLNGVIGYIPGYSTPTAVASANWTFPVATLAPLIPNNTSFGGTVFCNYYDSGSNYLGQTTVLFTVGVPPSVVPGTALTRTAAEVSTVGKTRTGSYVQNYSNVNVTVAGMASAGAYGSTVTSAKATITGLSGGSSTSVDYTLSTTADTTLNLAPILLSNPVGGQVGITTTLTDSRGRTGVSAVTYISVLAYTKPVLTAAAFTLTRALSTGVQDALGTFLIVGSAGSATSLKPASTEYNTLTWTLQTQQVGTSTWVAQGGTHALGTTLSWSTPSTLIGAASGTYAILANQAYNVLLTATDYFGNSTTMSAVMPVGTVTMSWGVDGIGVGKIRQFGALDVNGDTYTSGAFYQGGSLLVPTGVVVPYAVPSYVPGGWLLCNGQAVSRTTYLALFYVISTFYGAGDGSTTFNLPNLSGRVPIGSGNSGAAGATTHTQGQVGGEETHALTTAEGPSHTHTAASASNTGVVANGTAGTSANVSTGGGGYVVVPLNGSGSNTPHNNMQPYLSMNYIIKY